MIYQAIADLAAYAVRTGLIEESDRVWAINGLLEDLGHSETTSAFKNLNFEDYLLPTALDVPDCNTALLDEHPDPRSAFGGRSMGAPATEPGAAALLCAVNHALGRAGTIREVPADLDRVFHAANARN